MNLVIDIGNTQVKAAVFEENTIVDQSVFPHLDMKKKIESIVKDFSFQQAILSSVKNIPKEAYADLSKIPVFLELNHQLKLPFKNLYKTPETLGLDRIALVAAGSSFYPNQNVLIIDAGTGITYDFLDKDNQYHGGAISPGIQMRYNALNYYTDKLPKLFIKDDFSLVGKSTKEAIHSGVLNGVCQEIKGVINQYEQENGDLTVVLTGGDTKFLSKQLKNGIFANQNFLLYGLNTILNLNNNR